MNEYSLFRLKFQYKTENQETGEIEKAKMEALAQCANYTDAEALANKLMTMYGISKLDGYSYEIIKGKFDVSSLVGTSVLQHNKSLVCGLMPHFFENGNEGLYAVDTIVFGDKTAKEKDIKATYYIAATDVADAQDKACKVLQSDGYSLSDCLVSGAKLDNVEYLYLRPMTSETLQENANKIFA